MCPSGIQRNSYRNPKGLRSPRSPGKGTGKGLGKEGGDFDYAAYAAKHFPDAKLTPGLYAAIFKVRKRGESYPDPAKVRDLAERKGWLAEDRRLS